MSDEMLIETPEVEEIDPVVEETNEETAEDQPEPEVEAAPEPEGDGRSLPQWIKNLKASDPAAYKEAKGIFFGKKSFEDKLKDFDLDGTKSWLDETGGREAIAQKIATLEESANELNGINEALRTGNVDLIAEMAEAHPDSFPKLAEAAVAQWAKADPEGWERHHAGVISATISQSGIPLFLERMSLYLENGKTQEVQQSIQQLQQWTNSFGQTAAKQPQTRQQQQNPQFAEREQRLAQQETQMFTETVQRDVDSFRTPAIEAELKDFITRDPTNTDKREMAMEKIKSDVTKRLKDDKDYQGKQDTNWRNRDKEGFMRLLRSREAIAIKDIAPKVGRTIYGSPAAAKPAPKLVANVAKPAAQQVPGKPRDKFAEIFASA